MKKTYISPVTDIIIFMPCNHLLAGSIDSINPTGEGLPTITRGGGDGGGDPSIFSNKGLWEEE